MNSINRITKSIILAKSKLISKTVIIVFLTSLLIHLDVFSQSSNANLEQDRTMILNAINRYNTAWETRNVELAVKDYSSYIHWVNSVGDLMRTRKDLKEYLTNIFELDFIMKNERIPQVDEITFQSEKIAVVHSLHLESGSKNYHLRVFYKEGTAWKIINHITSREHPKNE